MILIDAIRHRVERKHTTIESADGRHMAGMSAGVVGLILNSFLALGKLIFGMMIHSIAVIADGVNNFSDAIGSLVVILGLRLAKLPPDREHPYGHGRMEYITGLGVSFLVLGMGLQFLYKSGERVLHPTMLEGQQGLIIFMVLSIVIKLWMRVFYKKLGKLIQSMPLEAAAADSLGDVLITTVVLLSYVLRHFFTFPIDGIVGVVVSIFIIKAGVELIKETLSPLLGEAPDPAMYEKIIQRAKEEPMIIGVHDIYIHNYGPGKHMATMDVEVCANNDVLVIHDALDSVEKDLKRELDLDIVLHIDPVGKLGKEEKRLLRALKQWVQDNDDILDIHDYRIVQGKYGANLCFEITIDGETSPHVHDLSYYRKAAEKIVHKHFPNRNFYMEVDIGFTKGK